MVVYVSRFAEDAHEDEFRSCVGVQAAGNEEIGDGDAVGRFGPFYREGAEAWRGYGIGVVEVDVGNDGEDGVEGCGEDLKGPGGL